MIEKNSNTGLSPNELVRYSRHLVLPEVRMEGQLKLKSASVLIVGAGGLGSPAALYLAAAGIGRLGIVDQDVVELSNLQRQIIHSTNSIGRGKSDSARERIRGLNPEVSVETFPLKLTSENALEVLKPYDVIIDGSDNFPTRYLLNDASVLLAKPLVYGCIFRFEGQASVFEGTSGPCYRCLFPEPPPAHLAPNCEEGGVLGVLPGVIGSIQATETIKIILGIGDLLVGKMLHFDALRMEFRTIRLSKDPACPMCGAERKITQLIDYEAFCASSSGGKESNSFEITPVELQQKLQSGRPISVIDVREPYEFEIANIGGRLIPLNELSKKEKLLSKDDEIIVVCHHGHRSESAVEYLRGRGFERVKNLVGGIDRWSVEVDRSVPRY